jgi:hypothetical protein
MAPVYALAISFIIVLVLGFAVRDRPPEHPKDLTPTSTYTHHGP